MEVNHSGERARHEGGVLRLVEKRADVGSG
jgi:hypothetical protein